MSDESKEKLLKRKCSVGPSIRTSLLQLTGETASRGPKKADARQLLRAGAWCKDVPELQRAAEQSLESWLLRWRKGPENRPKDAEQAEMEAKQLAARLGKVDGLGV